MQLVGLFSVGVVTLTHQPKTVACDNWNCNDIFYVIVRFNPIMFLQQALTFYLYKFYVIFFYSDTGVSFRNPDWVIPTSKTPSSPPSHPECLSDVFCRYGSAASQTSSVQ